MDSLDKQSKKIKRDTTGEIEGSYKGGNGKIRSLFSSNFKIPERTIALHNDGSVKVGFIIDTKGEVKDIAILQSVEFAFDEEAMRVISFTEKTEFGGIKAEK